MADVLTNLLLMYIHSVAVRSFKILRDAAFCTRYSALPFIFYNFETRGLSEIRNAIYF